MEDKVLEITLMVLSSSVVASFISSFIKDKTGNKYFDFAMKIINLIALNIGRAKNDETINK